MPTDQLDAVFGALADPTRRAILNRLTRGDATVGELCAPFAMSQPAVSRRGRCQRTIRRLPPSRWPISARTPAP